MHRIPHRLGALLIPALSLAALVGCGQTGPLYLPEEQPVPPPPTQPLEPEPINDGLSTPVPAPLGVIPLESVPESAEELPAEQTPE